MKFDDTHCFEGALLPRWDDHPDGPKIQSMSVCTCGAWWKDHRFVDGACPLYQLEISKKL